MSQASVESFLGRVITDERFRAKAIRSLENTCREEGLTLSPEELSYLKKVDLALVGQVTENLDKAIKRG